MKHLNFLIAFLLLSFVCGAQQYLSRPFEPANRKDDVSPLIAHVRSVYDGAAPEPGLTVKQQIILEKAYETRFKACKSLLESDRVILSGELYDYVNASFQKLLAANPSIDQSSKLVLFGDISYNAFTMGDNLIFVHIGLLDELRSEEEMAFVMAHELAHNSSGHMHTDLLAAVRQKTDAELQKAVRSAASRTYGNVTALNELLLPAILADKEESRRQEHEADSLGFVYYRNAGYDPQKAMGVFRSMELAESNRGGERIDVARLFRLTEADPVFNKAAAYRPSSSLGSFEKDTEMESYLRSHPYHRDRLTTIARIGSLPADTLYERGRDSVYESYRYIAGGEIVQACFKDEKLSRAFYYGAKMQQEFPGDQWSQNSLALVLAQLSYAKERRISGRYIDLQSPGFDENYDRTVYFVGSLSPAEAQALSERMLDGAPAACEDCFQNKLTRIIWAFGKGQYEQYELRKSLVEEELEASAYASFFREIDQYYLISGKSKKGGQ